MNVVRDADISGLGVSSKLGPFQTGTWHISNAGKASCLKPHSERKLPLQATLRPIIDSK
jgi:hypothetical protein